MARITRFPLKIFGSTAPGTDIEQFGSAQFTGIPNYTTDPTVIQALPTWGTGWSSAIVTADKAPYKQDVNAVDYVTTLALCYLMQQGIPEWDANTTYYLSGNPSYVQWNAGSIYLSLQDGNIGNVPPVTASNAFWKWMDPQELIPSGNTVNTLPRISNTAPGVGPGGSMLVVDSHVSDNNTNIIISLPLQFPDATIQSTAAAEAHVATRQVFTAGSGTYTTPTGCRQIIIRVLAGGGGGSGGGATGTNGGDGVDSTFGTITAHHGAHGAGGSPGTGGAGGTGAAGIVPYTIPGADGNGGAGGVAVPGGLGGLSAYNIGGSKLPAGPGGTNSGAGGQGGTSGSGGSAFSGGGGGAGEYVEITINSPTATYAYAVGTGGAAGTHSGNGQNGTAGSDGQIIVDEIY